MSLSEHNLQPEPKKLSLPNRLRLDCSLLPFLEKRRCRLNRPQRFSWRKDRDSNPGTPQGGQRFSRPPRSTTPASFRFSISGCKITHFFYSDKSFFVFILCLFLYQRFAHLWRDPSGAPLQPVRPRRCGHLGTSPKPVAAAPMHRDSGRSDASAAARLRLP